MPKRFRFSPAIAVLTGLLIVVGGVYLRNTAMLLEIFFFPQRVIALPAISVSYDLQVEWVGDFWEKAGLRKGDRVLEMDGQPVRSVAESARAVFAHSPGETVRVAVRRGADRLEFSGVLEPIRRDGFPWQEIAGTLYIAVALPALCLALGFFVAFRRPRDPVAWTVLAFVYSLAKISVSFGSHRQGWSAMFAVPDAFVDMARHGLLPIAALWFGLLFPDPASPHKVLPWLRWPLTILIAGIFLPLSTLAAGMRFAPQVFMPLERVMNAVVGDWINWTGQGAMVLGAANLVWKMIREKQPAARRRMKLLVAGIAAGCTPIAALLAWGGINGKGPLQYGEGPLIVALVALTLVPLTLAYVVLVQKAMDVSVAMRQGLRYSLASKGAFLVAPLLGAVVVGPLLIWALRQERPEGVRVVAFAVAAGILVLIRKFRTWLRDWVDRRYFREAIDSERILAELSEEVHRIVDPQALLETVARRIAETLHVPRVAALVERQGAFEPALAHGFGAQVPAAAFDSASAAVERLRETRVPVTVYLDDPESWVHREAPDDAPRLRELQAELLLPLAARMKLMGFLSLGPKQSEEPYSRSDLRLLQSLASQTGLALENSRLAQAIAEEATQRERLHREIEIAREVQERLFPKRAPVVAGLDLAGRCLPAQTIGGDYFDFLETPSGHVGLAIADVAGKGIPAALLMAGMQASLRSLTLAGVDDLAELMAKLNRLVYDASPANRFITFFYGIYDPASGRLRYASAGHNPALVVRAEGAVEWLRAKGVGLGLSPKARYEQGETTLLPGDRLVLYTDGVPEARAADGTEYGEERMVEVARRSADAGALLERLINEAAAFSGDAPRHDDITVIAARRGA